MIENLAKDDVLILRNCLLQSISNNHKYLREDLQNAVNNILEIPYSSFQEREQKLKMMIDDASKHLNHIEQLTALLEKFRDSQT